MEKQGFESSVDRSIKEKFVGIHVLANVNTMVRELIEARKYDIDLGFDLFEGITPTGYSEHFKKNLYQDEAEEKIEELENKIEDIESIIEFYESDILQNKNISNKKIVTGNALIDKLQEIKDELETMDFENYPKVFEYYLVSDYLANKLKEKNNIIVTDYNNPIWGRETSGQTILFDAVISEICYEMEILEGQQNSWENHNI